MGESEIRAVFVPSLVRADDTIEGLGIYSTEKKALDVLRHTLGRRTVEGLKEAQLVLWELDESEVAPTPLKHMLANECPICRQKTFWTDAIELNALCYAQSCQAWIEHSDLEEEVVDCGWPPIGFTTQSSNLADALQLLRVYGAKIRGSGEHASKEMFEQLDGGGST